MKKTMIIGLGPEYNYPQDYKVWYGQNTEYASNHGASLISRALEKQFNGEFVSVNQFSDIQQLREKYDQCIIAFATHVTTWRDVSTYTSFVEKLQLPTFCFSLGVQDYSGDTNSFLKIHHSLKRLLSIVSERSKLIGVRGPFTASILAKNGFNNVIPIGCPTMYWNLNADLSIIKPIKVERPALVYHRTVSDSQGAHLIKNVPLIGQDFLDEAIFTKNLAKDKDLVKSELEEYKSYPNSQEVFKLIKKNGVFHTSFQSWFDYIGSRDFIFGPRLHGCICGLIQGIPAVMFARDLRVKEIADFFDIPYIDYDNLAKKKNIQVVFEEADYTKFNQTYKVRYNNYIKFLSENGLNSNLDSTSLIADLLYTNKDIRSMNYILNKDIQDIKLQLNDFKQALQTADALYKGLGKIPFAKRLGKKLN
jgi:hypothetical protein